MSAVAHKLTELDDKRKLIEAQLRTINLELTVYHEKNYHKSLVDDQGFPRDDLDFGELTSYRNLKRQYNELNNDYKDIMKEIEQNLFSLHDAFKESGQADLDMAKAEAAKVEKIQQEEIKAASKIDASSNQVVGTSNNAIPFAEITEVSEESPSDKAGVRLGDLIVTLGPVNHLNHDNLKLLVQTIKLNIGKPIEISVLRTYPFEVAGKDSFIYQGKTYLINHHTLTPQVWKGQGVLGCRFKAI